jgi:hypothetical protein
MRISPVAARQRLGKYNTHKVFFPQANSVKLLCTPLISFSLTPLYSYSCHSLWLAGRVESYIKNGGRSATLLEYSTHLGLTTRFLLLSDTCGFVDVGRSLWRENGSAVYNCCWSSPVQSFLGPSPAGRTSDHILLSHIRDSPNLEGQVPIFISPRKRVDQLYPQALVSFPSPPTTRTATVEVFEPASTRLTGCSLGIPRYIAWGRPHGKRFLNTACLLACYPSTDVHYPATGSLLTVCLRGNVFIAPLPSSGSIHHNNKGTPDLICEISVLVRASYVVCIRKRVIP